MSSSEQFLSSLGYLSLREQLYEPSVLVHTSLVLQLCFPDEHSSTSRKTIQGRSLNFCSVARLQMSLTLTSTA